MLYFDDFMEAIESLPSELSESLTTVRHLDHQAQNTIGLLNSRISVFFDNCRYSRLSEKEKEVEYQLILNEYDRALDYSKKKTAIVRTIYEMYQKLMKKLDSELDKFRLELEADNSGVTSKIEHRIRTLLGRNMPGTNRLDKRRSKYRAGHLFSANRVIPRRRPAYSHDAPDRQFYVLKRRFAAFDTSPMPLPLVSSCNGNSVSFFPEDGSNTLMSDGANRVSSSGNLRRIPSTGSIESIDQNMPDHEFSSFHTESQDFCDEDDDLQLTIDSTKRGRTLTTPQRSAGTPVDVPGRDPHRSHHGGTCYSPFVATSDTEAVALGTAGSNIVTDQSIDDLLTNPTVPASPSVKCGDSPRWLGSASITDKTRRVGAHSRRPSRMSSSTVDSSEETGGYVSSNEFHHHPHRYTSTHSPARSIKDQQQESLPMAAGTGGEADEQRYCFCNDVSYGDMIACDAPNCPFEWFHYSCVGLTVAPKGQWFCPSCAKGGAISTRFAGASSAARKRANNRR